MPLLPYILRCSADRIALDVDVCGGQVDFVLPAEPERLQMVTMYLEKYVLKPPSDKAKPIKVPCLTMT